MNKKRILITIGTLIYIAISIIKIFIYKIPDAIYITLGLISIFLILYGYFKENDKTKDK